MRTLLATFAAVLAILLLPANAQAQEERADWLDIELGKSVVLETPRIPTAIAITQPEIDGSQEHPCLSSFRVLLQHILEFNHGGAKFTRVQVALPVLHVFIRRG